MTEQSITAGRAFYERHIALLERGDIEGLVSGQYHENAVLIGADLTLRGRQALREHFAGYLARMGFIRVKSTDSFNEVDDSIFFEATIITAGGEARVYDIFLLSAGKAVRQFTGLISFSPFPAQGEGKQRGG
jgi:hypothetical protein